MKELGGSGAITHTLDMLSSSDSESVERAVKALAADRSTTGAVLRRLRKETRPTSRAAMVTALLGHGNMSAWDLMVDILIDSHEDAGVRVLAAQGVVSLAPHASRALAQRARTLLLDAAGSDAPDVESAFRRVIDALNTVALSPQVEQESVVLGDEAAKRALRDLRSGEEAVAVAAATELSKARGFYDVLASLLASEERPANRHAILYAISWQADLRALELLLKILADSNELPRLRGQAAEGVSYLFFKIEPKSPGFQMAVDALMHELSSTFIEVRYCAANALGASGYLPAIAPLMRLLEDRSSVLGWVGTVSSQAEDAIARIRESNGERVK